MLDYTTVNTPAFIIDDSSIAAKAELIQRQSNEAGAHALFSLKSMCLPAAIRAIEPHIDGFSICSPFEATLARALSSRPLPLHLTSPGYVQIDYDNVLGSTDYVSCNSLSQLARQNITATSPYLGVRLLTKSSFVNDDRYNPSRSESKLGVQLDAFCQAWAGNRQVRERITGIHFHNNCESRDFRQLLTTAHEVANQCGDVLRALQWINLGGGYLFDSDQDYECFQRAVSLFVDNYNLSVYIEPGAAFVRSSGELVASVVDKFNRGTAEIVILDTTVNHLPEVFEFQYEPDVLDALESGDHKYILAGCSCLAGDIFGEYEFDKAIEVGDRIVIQNVGDYTTTKWHYFNGINLPSIYRLATDGALVLEKEHTYEAFAIRNGVDLNAFVRS